MLVNCIAQLSRFLRVICIAHLCKESIQIAQQQTFAHRTGTKLRIGSGARKASPPTPVSGGVFLNCSAGGLEAAVHTNQFCLRCCTPCNRLKPIETYALTHQYLFRGQQCCCACLQLPSSGSLDGLADRCFVIPDKGRASTPASWK